VLRQPALQRSFLEKIFEGLPRVLRARRLRGGGFLLHSYPHGVERTVVAFVLARNSLRDGLAAFETAGRIKVRALAAGMNRRPALGALAGGFNSCGQKRATLSTAGNVMGARHLYRTRAESIFFRGTFPTFRG